MHAWIWFVPCSAVQCRVHSTRQPNVNKLNGARDLRIFRVTASALLQQLHRTKMSFLLVNFLVFFIFIFQFIQMTSVIVNTQRSFNFQPVCENEWTWNIAAKKKMHGICVVYAYEKNRFTYFCYTFKCRVCFACQFDHFVVCRCHIAVGIILLFTIRMPSKSIVREYVYCA